LRGSVSLSSGPCLGLCPVFTMKVNTEDRYRLNSGANTINEGRSTGALTIIRETEESQKVVTYDVGCLDFAEKDSLDLLVEGLYRTFRINDLVAVGEPPKAEDQQ